MPKTTMSNDPADFTVEHIRARSGLLVGLVITQKDEPRCRFEFDGDGSLDRLLREAREVAGGDPRDIRLPSDRAMVVACLLAMGVDIPEDLMADAL